MTMGFMPRLPWIITLLMPFKATILAFMMGSEMESNSAERAHKHAHINTLVTVRDSAALLLPLIFTQICDHRVWCGSLSNQGLHLFLLLLLLPLLVQEVL